MLGAVISNLAVAIILVLIVIRWGILSNHSVGATGSGPTASGSLARRKPADADLSMFDKLMINLGLAELLRLQNTEEIPIPKYG